MNIQSILILTALGVWAAAAVRSGIKGKRRGCCGDCVRCEERRKCQL